MTCAPTNNASDASRGQFRSSKRITITLNYATYKALEDKSSEEGRSVSNLASYLLERSLMGGTERKSA
jgi:hypothetical protein